MYYIDSFLFPFPRYLCFLFAEERDARTVFCMQLSARCRARKRSSIIFLSTKINFYILWKLSTLKIFLWSNIYDLAPQRPGGLYVERGQGEGRQADCVQQDAPLQGHRLRRVQGPGVRASRHGSIGTEAYGGKPATLCINFRPVCTILSLWANVAPQTTSYMGWIAVLTTKFQVMKFSCPFSSLALANFLNIPFHT